MRTGKSKNSADLPSLSSGASRSGVKGPRVSGHNSESKLEDSIDHHHFRSALLTWYDEHKRDLPWRRSRDPYRIWVSEIMLQQTRVAAVIQYYDRFLRRFPTVQKLAAARLDSVLAAWSGLGYYRRARALHAAAKQIANRDGEFPKSATEWRSLPGIGRYTSAAIASMAFGEPVAVVDGNVQRVLSRVAGMNLTGEQSWQFAQTLLSTSRPGDSNQALMELGAIVCLPRDPQCLVCPMRHLCSRRGELPVTETAKRQKREIYYSLMVNHGAILLKRRSATSSLMPGMWELPQIPCPNGDTATATKFTLRHSITVTDYMVRVCQNNQSDAAGGRWFSPSRIPSLPLTGLTRKILRAAGIIQ